MSSENITFVGIVVQTILWLLAAYALVIRHDESNKHLKDKVEGMKEELEKLSEVITQMAVQTIRVDNLNQQVTMLQRTVEDLRRGPGWVGTPARKSIDGEYPE